MIYAQSVDMAAGSTIGVFATFGISPLKAKIWIQGDGTGVGNGAALQLVQDATGDSGGPYLQVGLLEYGDTLVDSGTWLETDKDEIYIKNTVSGVTITGLAVFPL